jgi:hypothetical protein
MALFNKSSKYARILIRVLDAIQLLPSTPSVSQVWLLSFGKVNIEALQIQIWNLH